MLQDAGGVIVKNDTNTLEIHLLTERIGTLEFTMFKRDGQDSKRAADDIFSLFCQLPTKKQVEQFAPQVNLVFGQGVHQVMNPFSGKWNIHESDADSVVRELEKRIVWLSKKHNNVYSHTVNA